MFKFTIEELKLRSSIPKNYSDAQITNSDKEFCEYLNTIFTLDIPIDEKHSLLFRIAWYIFIQSPNLRSSTNYFVPTIFEEKFQEYMYSWDLFARARIPIIEWKDVCIEGLNLLVILIKENKLIDFEKDDRVKTLYQKLSNKCDELIDKGYDQLLDPMGL